MQPKNFFAWLREDVGVIEPPLFGNPDTALYTLNDDIVEISIYRDYIIENAGGHQNVLVVSSFSPPTTILLSRVSVTGIGVRWGYDTYTNTAYVSYESWQSPTLTEEEAHE